ncbi:hypothetical protein [Nitrospirillum pindoramense]|uniref:Uncharacterized protein n=1 Tax=Nitrospirillum amazonense TaxID=28077 RepID=A0A560GYU3_9PROT|nr:hypothetical protein [Nitrospirillum amazonense]TWB39217.1 hypothetical protein FBZ90_111214 [Nitrospirillum amazonense]
MRKIFLGIGVLLLSAASAASSADLNDPKYTKIKIMYGANYDVCNILRDLYQVNAQRKIGTSEYSPYVIERLAEIYNSKRIEVPKNEGGNSSLVSPGSLPEGWWHDAIYNIDIFGDGQKRVVYLRQDAFGVADHISRIWVFKPGEIFSPISYSFEYRNLKIKFDEGKIEYFFSQDILDAMGDADMIAKLARYGNISLNNSVITLRNGGVNVRTANFIMNMMGGEKHIIRFDEKYFIVSGLPGKGDAIVYAVSNHNSSEISCLLKREHDDI